MALSMDAGAGAGAGAGAYVKKRPYPFAHDKLAKKQFDMYLGSIHGVMSPTTKVIVYTLLLGLLVGIVFLILVYGAEVEL